MIALLLALLGGTPARADDLQVVAQVLLEQPETLLAGGLIGPPESRATWCLSVWLLTALDRRRRA